MVGLSSSTVFLDQQFGDATLKVHSATFKDGTSVSISKQHDISYIEDSVTCDDRELLKDFSKQEAEANFRK